MKLIAFKRHKPRLSAWDIVLFFRQFATLVTANMPITLACDILLEGQHNRYLQEIIRSLKHDLNCGESLSYAMRKYPQHFDPFTCQLIQIGEQTGTLASLLTRIAHIKENALNLKRTLQQALSYPTFVFILSTVITAGLLAWIVPQFAELFQQTNSPLPPLTLAILSLSHFVHDDFIICLLPWLSIPIGIKYYKHSLGFKRKLDATLFTIPYLGTLFKKHLLAKFSRSFSILFSAGIPITLSLSLLHPLSQNLRYQTSVEQLHLDIMSGVRLHHAMQTNSFFPPMMIHMVQVGEESGSLDLMLKKIADFYENDIHHLADQAKQLLEPLIIIILGVLIGVLVIALYLPIFKLGTVI